jgi:hypothetical protein
MHPQASNVYVRSSSFTLITSFTLESMLMMSISGNRKLTKYSRQALQKDEKKWNRRWEKFVTVAFARPHWSSTIITKQTRNIKLIYIRTGRYKLFKAEGHPKYTPKMEIESSFETSFSTQPKPRNYNMKNTRLTMHLFNCMPMMCLFWLNSVPP